MSQENKSKRIPSILLIAGIVILFFVFMSRIVPIIVPAKPQIIDSESLKKKVSISELSTAKFTYNGIAVYKEDDKEKCKILYHGDVKAGIDFSDIDFVFDKDNKTIKPILPEIRLSTNVIDENSLSFIPSKAQINLGDALKVCKEDIQNEANACEELWSAAKESLRNSIEGLIYPLAQANGYTIIWE